MKNQSLTETSPTLRGSYHFKRRQDEEKAIAAAKVALTEFEGVRVTRELQHQNGLVLFNEKYQRLSNLQALQAMNGRELPENKKSNSKRLSRIRLKRKKKNDISGSRLSIDYEHFEIPSQNTSQSTSGVSSGQTESETLPGQEVTLAAQSEAADLTAEDGTDSETDDTALREFDVEGCFEMETVGLEDEHELGDTTDSNSPDHLTAVQGSSNLTLINGSPVNQSTSSEIVVKFDEDPSEIPADKPHDGSSTSNDEEPPPVTYIDDLPVTDIDHLILETDSLPDPPGHLLTDTSEHPLTDTQEHLLDGFHSVSPLKVSLADVPSTGWYYQPNSATSQWSLNSDKVDTRL